MTPVNSRPRSYAERPTGPLAPKPANDNVLGTWENGVFRFASPEAKETWKRKSYEQGVGEETWHLGKEIDPQSAGLMTAGFGGATAGLYQAPDGTYRQMNAKTIESQEARDHRSKYLTGKTIDQIAAANVMPGADEWVAKGKVARGAANDNAVGGAAPTPTPVQPADTLSAEDKKPPSAVLPVQTDQGVGQMMAGRFGAMKAIADGRIADKYDIQKPTGKWVGDAFVFNSLEDHQRAIRGLYRQGVGEDTWHLGKVIDPKNVDTAAANPGLYYAPDGTYRLMNTETVESQTARDHRTRYLAVKSIKDVADGETMPGENEWVDKWTSQWEQGRPSLGHRFSAKTAEMIVDGGITGKSLQAFASGYARNPDTLATRPNDAFSQSGSYGMLEWHRLNDDLGISGTRRLIDFAPQAVREKAQSEWGKMSAQQQTGMRNMWTEKQADYLPWWKEFERRVAVPWAETKVEKVADFAGGIAGGVLSPDNWFMLEGPFAELAPAGRMSAAAGAAKGLARIGDNVVESAASVNASASASGLKTEASNLLTNGAKNVYDPFGRLPNINTRVFTNKETYHLTGDETGLAFVLETPTSNPAALAFENRLSGRIIHIETKKIMSPSLLFRNPNGLHVARFDGVELAPDGSTVLMVDGKLRYPYFFNMGAMEDARKTLRRWREALEQNPGYSIMVVFPNEEEMLAAQAAFKLEGVSDRIFAKVIENE